MGAIGNAGSQKALHNDITNVWLLVFGGIADVSWAVKYERQSLKKYMWRCEGIAYPEMDMVYKDVWKKPREWNKQNKAGEMDRG